MNTIRLHFDWPGFREDFEDHIRTCDECQIHNGRKETKHIYKVDDQVLIVLGKDERRTKRKLKSPTEGPYKITQVFANNGMVRINRKGFEEIMSIRRLRPYH